MSTKIKSVFSQRASALKPNFSLENFAEQLQEGIDLPGSVIAGGRELARVSVEGFDDLNQDQRSSLQNAYETMESLLSDLGFESFNARRGSDEAMRVSENQIAAATLANLAGYEETRYKKALRGMTSVPQSNDPNVITISPMLDGPHGNVQALSTGLENYNEKSQRDFRVISVAYNLAASRQDAFGEAIYPTVVVNPTEGGVTQNLTYAAVLKDVFHETSGAVFDTKEVNMVEAFRDPDILEDTATKLVPVVDEQNSNAANFVDATLVAPREVDLGRGGILKTAPLKIGKQFDLLGLSNRQQLIAGNLLDISDTIDPAMRLKAVYVKLDGGKVVRFMTERLPTAVFQPALTGDTRQANLAFNTEDLVISATTKTVDGTAQAGLTEVETRGWTLRLAMSVNGSVSLSKGNTWIHATPVVVERVYDETDEKLALSSAEVQTVLTALGAMEVVGYDLEARFTNTNRRERGQLVQTRTMQFRHAIPMLSPITLPMSTMDESGPGAVVKTLTVAANIRNSNAAVTRLLNYLSQLREMVTAGYDRPQFGAIEGALQVMMRPTYRYAQLDLRNAIDTLRSKDRWEDVTATILNTIKGILYPAYRDSNIEAAFQTVSGNADERPKFIIACDKEIAHYMMQRGDERTLGAYLKYDIVSTNNSDFDGKIVVIPTRENPVENDILNFGQFYYVPTIVADLPISRNGQISREIAAVPFNLHVNNIPFAIEIDVAGLKEVMGESQYNTMVSDGFTYVGDSNTTDTTTTTTSP